MKETYPVSVPRQLAVTLRALRKSRALTQTQLGNMLGLTQERIVAIESAPGRTSFDQIARCVALLGGRLVIEIESPEKPKKPGAKSSPTSW